MMKRNNAASNVASLKTQVTGILFLLVVAGISMAQNSYKPPSSLSGEYNKPQSYGNSYQPFNIRDLYQSDVKNCTDLTCGMEQCCVETQGAKICVALLVTNDTIKERMCVRPKLCSTDFNCPTDSCCVYSSYVTADTICPETPDYSKYPPHSYPGQTVKPLEGICQPQPNKANATCYMSITGNPLCPCGVDDDGDSLMCVEAFPGSFVGTCQESS